ncbi:hypothetical protein B0H14DRAFT_3771677, partial [Mycena olivaceomarginata]
RSSPTSLPNEIAGRLKIVELNIWDNLATNLAEAEAVIKIEIIQGHVYGTMHGGCAVFLFDPCTAASIVLLARAKGFDGSAVSTSMNVPWHHPAHLGSTLIVTTRSVFVDGRARLARGEMRNKATGQLILSGTHALLNAGKARL